MWGGCHNSSLDISLAFSTPWLRLHYSAGCNKSWLSNYAVHFHFSLSQFLRIIYGIIFLESVPSLLRVQLNRFISTNRVLSPLSLSLSTYLQLAITQNWTLITILYQVRMIYLSLSHSLSYMHTLFSLSLSLTLSMNFGWKLGTQRNSCTLKHDWFGSTHSRKIEVRSTQKSWENK